MRKSSLSRIFFPSRSKTRLRNILQLGILLEERGEEFYGDCAEKAQDAGVRELFRKLADDEVEHRKLIEDQLARWEPLPVRKKTLERLDPGGTVLRLFSSPPSPGAGKREIIDFALNVERQMVSFYEDFRSEFPERWKMAKLEGMVEEEKGHIRDLNELLES